MTRFQFQSRKYTKSCGVNVWLYCIVLMSTCLVRWFLLRADLSRSTKRLAMSASRWDTKAGLIIRLIPGLETYFFSNSQTFASGFNLNSQVAVCYSQLVLLLFQRLIHSNTQICWYVVYKLVMIKMHKNKAFEREKRRKKHHSCKNIYLISKYQSPIRRPLRSTTQHSAAPSVRRLSKYMQMYTPQSAK